ncbi:MAG: aerobic respiration two-component sensor histidine kinase ArcB [Psychromonas sp.]
MQLFNLKTWVRYYVALLKRLGVLRFSLLLALAIISADSALQVLLAIYFSEPLGIVDISRSILIGLIITPWAVYFLTVVVGDLEEAREHLGNTVASLQEMRQKDLLKTHELEKEIIERKKSQQELVEAAILLKSFINTSPDLVFHRDLDGRFVSCNKAMEKLTGKTEQELIGLTPFDIFPEDYAQQVVARDEKVKQLKQEQIHEHWLHFPNGQQAFFEVRALPLFNSESLCTGIIGFGRDITERKKYQESIEKNIRHKTEFISTISHELRTPLNGIVGLSRMLLDEQLTAEQTKHLKTIHISAITLGNIFNDIVNLDKLDRQRLNLVANNINMLDFISDLKSLAFIQTEQKGLTLVFEQQGDFPDYIEADDTRLRQVLWNLISNAVKFTQLGSVSIRCWCDPVSLEQVELCFEVEDSGIGIPQDQLDKIFAMYYQVEGNTFATGSGIGLAVSSKIAKAMGGVITVDSKLGEGSTFKLTLTVNCPRVDHQEANVQANLPQLSILLVEDIELNILVAKSLLEKLGHEVDTAVNGAQALDKVKHNSYQLILMDIQLPDMDGYQITQRLRAINGQNLPPIVALTANVFADNKIFLAQGMDDALAKPLSVKPLNAMINKLFKPADGQQQIESLSQKQLDQQADTLFDQQMLVDLMDFLPTSVILNNILLFEKLLPEYLDVLDSNMIAKDQKGIVNEAHKIKGAAGAIGLKRIQQLAQKIQSPDLPAWWDNIDDWVELIKSEYENDLTGLKKWVVANGK